MVMMYIEGVSMLTNKPSFAIFWFSFIAFCHFSLYRYVTFYRFKSVAGWNEKRLKCHKNEWKTVNFVISPRKIRMKRTQNKKNHRLKEKIIIIIKKESESESERKTVFNQIKHHLRMNQTKLNCATWFWSCSVVFVGFPCYFFESLVFIPTNESL